MSDRPLFMWTIYDHPSDFPDCFVARRWVIQSGAAAPTDEVVTGLTLDAIRARLRELDPNTSTPLPRSEGDDPKIVETWI